MDKNLLLSGTPVDKKNLLLSGAPSGQKTSSLGTPSGQKTSSLAPPVDKKPPHLLLSGASSGQKTSSSLAPPVDKKPPPPLCSLAPSCENTNQNSFYILLISGTQNSEDVKKEWEAQMFCCLSLQNPLMCDEEDRMRTFPASWCDQECPTAREMVDAGFYKGSGDCVRQYLTRMFLLPLVSYNNHVFLCIWFL